MALGGRVHALHAFMLGILPCPNAFPAATRLLLQVCVEAGMLALRRDATQVGGMGAWLARLCLHFTALPTCNPLLLHARGVRRLLPPFGCR